MLKHYEVALHPEGVDRNHNDLQNAVERDLSPSTRRAWIEIQDASWGEFRRQLSPSTRRAWIEIYTFRYRE